MNKLLIICGPTASGKTSFALKLAKKIDGELVSADSRQVYKGMDIGTGKDIPKDSQWELSELSISNNQFPIGFWKTKGGIRIWGYDFVEPDKEFSVAEYIKIVRSIIEDIWDRDKLPILVGGTGFYIKGVVDGIDTVGVSKNEKLRNLLKDKSSEELLRILKELDPHKARSLNESDKKNPRRLIRAIEVVKSESSNSSTNLRNELKADVKFIGLRVPKDDLSKRIGRRIKERLGEGFLEEVKLLREKGLSWDEKAMTATGYRQLKSFIAGEKTLDESTRQWTLSEIKYAKRQMTWFKKDKRINWFDTSEKKFQEAIEKFVLRWYFKGKDVSKKN